MAAKMKKVVEWKKVEEKKELPLSRPTKHFNLTLKISEGFCQDDCRCLLAALKTERISQHHPSARE